MARGEARFWAIVETLAAMAVFWRLAIRYETFLLLTTSLFVAPLLLLRSDESTRLGVKWFDEGSFRPGGRTIPRRVRKPCCVGWGSTPRSESRSVLASAIRRRSSISSATRDGVRSGAGRASA